MRACKAVMTCGDVGPWVSKLILDWPDVAGEASIRPDVFNVFARRVDSDRGGEDEGQTRKPLEGYLVPRAAYPCDKTGRRVSKGTLVALELGEEPLTALIVGGLRGSRRVMPRFRVTQLEAVPGKDGAALGGLVFESSDEVIAPELDGWEFFAGAFKGESMAYAVYSPDLDSRHRRAQAPGTPQGSSEPTVEKVPLVVWLHGGGEGGSDPWITVCGNKVTALSGEHIQTLLGGAAFVLAPTCPTYWMDDGVTQLGTSNESKWSEPVLELIETFLAAHSNRIDGNRIYIGGLSNGGFLTLRLLADCPDRFACGVAVCAPFYEANRKEWESSHLARTPLWLVHCKQDRVVSAQDTVLPLYHSIKRAGADNLHLSYYEENISSHYVDEDGRPKRFPGHPIWIKVYEDDPRTELDGRRVTVNDMAVTLWEWVGLQRRQTSD